MFEVVCCLVEKAVHWILESKIAKIKEIILGSWDKGSLQEKEWMIF